METYSIEINNHGKIERFVIKSFTDDSEPVINVYIGEDFYFNLSPGKFTPNDREDEYLTPEHEIVDPYLVKLITAEVINNED